MLHTYHELESFGNHHQHCSDKFDWMMDQLNHINPPRIEVSKKSDNKVVLYYMIRNHSYYAYMAYISLLSWAKCTDFENVDVVIHTTTPRLFDLANRILLPIADNIKVILDKFHVKLGYFEGFDKYEMIHISDADLIVSGEDKEYFTKLLSISSIHALVPYSTYGRYVNNTMPGPHQIYSLDDHHKLIDQREQGMAAKGWEANISHETEWPLGCIYYFPRNQLHDWSRFCRDFVETIDSDSDELAIVFYCNHYNIKIEYVEMPCIFGPPIRLSNSVLVCHHIWNDDQSNERHQAYVDSIEYLRKLESHFGG